MKCRDCTETAQAPHSRCSHHLERNRENYKRWRQTEKGRIRKWRENGIDGMTAEKYDELFAAQNGRCAICDEAQAENLCVDHDHVTGEVRGLLCKACNRGIGALGDDPSRVARAALYLQTSRAVVARSATPVVGVRSKT